MATSQKHPLDFSDDDEDWEDSDKNKNDTAMPIRKTSEESDVKTDSEAPRPYEPELNSELLVKPTCECMHCRHWSTSVDWCPRPDFQFETQENKGEKQKGATPLLKSEKHPGKTPKIRSFRNCLSSKIQKQSTFKTLVHGEVIPPPMELLSDQYFHESIHLSLKNLNYRYSLPIQSFGWPAVFGQLNVMLISGRKSGKTMAYLPAICTFAVSENQRYQELAKYKGPLIIIVCPNSKKCEEVFDLIKKIYSNIRVKPKISIITYPIPNINHTDILVTIPDSLTYCLKSRIFNLKRLCHFVFENASTMLKNDEENVHRLLSVANEMLEHRTSRNKVQLIVTSEKWTSDMKRLLKSVYTTPLVCIGNYLEAALYGNIQFEVKFLMSYNKNAYLEGILKNQSYIYKTIIICDDSEVTDLNKYLVRNGIETIALSDSSGKEDIEECENLWNTAPCGQYKALICSNFVFDTLLSIDDAMWLIHYSFPSTWTRFSKRFSVLSANYQSPLIDDKEKNKNLCKSVLMIDESCEAQMPQILNLLNRLSKDLPPTYQKYAEGFKAEIEDKKVSEKVQLCENVKLLGKCPTALCSRRHTLNTYLDVASDLPANGKIVFKILAMRDVTQYVVQLRKHIDLDGRVRKINSDNLKRPLKYGSNEEKKRIDDIEVGEFYAHRENTTEGEEFMLCHVLKIVNETFVEVKLMTGVTLQTLRTKLYEPPPDITIATVYMCNLIPPHKDEQFSGRSFHATRSSFETIEYRDIVFTADVCLQLDRTLWIDNVVEVVQVGESEFVKFNLTKHLLELKVVESNKNQIAALYKLCEKCGISLPSYAKPTAKKQPVKEKEIEPQRAFLDDNPTEILLSSAITPEEFYVRLQKFQILLENLEKDLKKLVESEILDKDINVVPGKYYIALDPQGKTYSRAMVLRTEDDRALLFYVDYGDEAVKNISELKKLPTKFITRLPFQAIQCRLHGLSPNFDEWETEATDVLYKYMFEPESDIFRSLFVKVCGTEESDPPRTKVKYSVLLKDGFGSKNILINQLLIDCGFASSIFPKTEDFELPKFELNEDSDSGTVESYEENDRDDNFWNVDQLEFDEEDLELFDEQEFFNTFFPWSIGTRPRNQQIPQNLQQLEYRSQPMENQNISTEDQAAGGEEKSKYLTPEVYWSQTEKTVKLKVQLIGVENYKVSVIRKRIFTFSTELEGKKYELKFTLHKIAELDKHAAKGQEVQIILSKMEPCEWLQLTGTSKRLRNIHYEVPDEVEPPRRKFLQLDITDDESDGDDNIMYEVVSDLDSEFDEEVKSSSSD